MPALVHSRSDADRRDGECECQGGQNGERERDERATTGYEWFGILGFVILTRERERESVRAGRMAAVWHFGFMVELPSRRGVTGEVTSAS